MARSNLNDLLAFVTVAREGSFTRAASQLGVTQSAVSQAVSGLEQRLDIRLLTRTTRSVAPTPAGERLMRTLGNRLDEIEAELAAVTELRDKPAGTVRITSGDFPLRTILLPKLAPLMRDYPDIHIEFDVSYGLRDIVADRFDAGVRLGERVERDMIALPIGPMLRMATVASPAYWAQHAPPKHPRDLPAHRCINMRFPTHGGLYVWEYERAGREQNVRVNSTTIFNASHHVVAAALEGLGIAHLPADEFGDHIQAGRLIQVLKPWCPPFSGYHLYYPSRRQPSPAFRLVLDALRRD